MEGCPSPGTLGILNRIQGVNERAVCTPEPLPSNPGTHYPSVKSPSFLVCVSWMGEPEVTESSKRNKVALALPLNSPGEVCVSENNGLKEGHPPRGSVSTPPGISLFQ